MLNIGNTAKVGKNKLTPPYGGNSGSRPVRLRRKSCERVGSEKQKL